MNKSDQLILFGFDLRHAVAHLPLGLAQVFLGDELGLKGRLYPPIEVLRLSEHEKTDLPSFDSSESYAAVLPDSVVLFRELALPSMAEIFLSDVVASEVAGSAPFAPEDTLLG